MYYRIFAALLYLPIGIYFYFFFRRILKFILKKEPDNIYKIILALCVAVIVSLSSNPYGVWIVVFSHLFVFSLITDLIMFILKKAKKLKKKNNLFNKAYNIGIIPIALTLIFLVYAYLNMTNVVVKYYDINTSKNLENDYKVIFLSDLHFKTTMNEEKLEEYVEEISSLNPDAVILGGDIVDENTSRESMFNVFEILGNIETNYGIFFVYGNHDKAKYYSNRKYTDEEIQNAIESSGIITLVDENYMINDELILIGRDDTTFPRGTIRKSTNELVEGLDSEDFWLVIDHHPFDLEENAEIGYDLQLSGHTHGGQIFPTGLLSEIFDKENLNYGYREINDFQAIVTSGIGGWAYPFRTGNNSEYVVVNISGAK